MSNLPRIFCEGPGSDNQVVLDADTYHYLRDVLRLKPGESIDIVSPTAVYSGQVVMISAKPPRIEIENIISTAISPPSYPITLIQCLPKGDKMSDIIRCCTEMGVARIIPVISDRCVSVPKNNSRSKVDRWQAIAKSAASQSRQSAVPVIAPIETFTTALAQINAGPTVVFWEESSMSLATVMSTISISPTTPISIIIGPEGGLSAAEVNDAIGRGGVVASLGDTILRVEHAGLVALAQLNYAILTKD
ncbi:16S rRNA (uracil(1498)-N(3))-methyltransferase [bacterium]|nr:16S rRNA (uracil(1498)-N(3))-methyltransferase [bacterium]